MQGSVEIFSSPTNTFYFNYQVHNHWATPNPHLANTQPPIPTGRQKNQISFSGACLRPVQPLGADRAGQPGAAGMEQPVVWGGVGPHMIFHIFPFPGKATPPPPHTLWLQQNVFGEQALLLGSRGVSLPFIQFLQCLQC